MVTKRTHESDANKQLDAWGKFPIHGCTLKLCAQHTGHATMDGSPLIRGGKVFVHVALDDSMYIFGKRFTMQWNAIVVGMFRIWGKYMREAKRRVRRKARAGDKLGACQHERCMCTLHWMTLHTSGQRTYNAIARHHG